MPVIVCDDGWPGCERKDRKRTERPQEADA